MGEPLGLTNSNYSPHYADRNFNKKIAKLSNSSRIRFNHEKGELEGSTWLGNFFRKIISKNEYKAGKNKNLLAVKLTQLLVDNQKFVSEGNIRQIHRLCKQAGIIKNPSKEFVNKKLIPPSESQGHLIQELEWLELKNALSKLYPDCDFSLCCSIESFVSQIKNSFGDYVKDFFDDIIGILKRKQEDGLTSALEQKLQEAAEFSISSQASEATSIFVTELWSAFSGYKQTKLITEFNASPLALNQELSHLINDPSKSYKVKEQHFELGKKLQELGFNQEEINKYLSEFRGVVAQSSISLADALVAYCLKIRTRPTMRALFIQLEGTAGVGLPIIREINRLFTENPQHSSISTYQKILSSKPKTLSEVQIQFTTPQDQQNFFRIYEQKWNLKDWPQKLIARFPEQVKLLFHTEDIKAIEKQLNALTENEKIDVCNLFEIYQKQPTENLWKQLLELRDKIPFEKMTCFIDLLYQDISLLEVFLTFSKEQLSVLARLKNDLGAFINEIKFLASLEYPLKAYFFRLLDSSLKKHKGDQASLDVYESAKKMFIENPDLLNALIKFESRFGIPVFRFVGKISSKQLLDYLSVNPKLRKIVFELDDPQEMLRMINSILTHSYGKEALSKCVFVYKNSPQQLYSILKYVEQEIVKTDQMPLFLDFDKKIIKENASVFRTLFNDICSPFGAPINCIEVLWKCQQEDFANLPVLLNMYNNLENDGFIAFTKLLKLLSPEIKDKCLTLANEFSRVFLRLLFELQSSQVDMQALENISKKAAYLTTLQNQGEQGLLNWFYIYPEHLDTEKYLRMHSTEILLDILKMYPVEIQDKFTVLLDAWHFEPNLGKLNSDQQFLICSILLTPNSIDVILACAASLPLSNKLLILGKLNEVHSQTVQKFLETKPEYAELVLDFLYHFENFYRLSLNNSEAEKLILEALQHLSSSGSSYLRKSDPLSSLQKKIRYSLPEPQMYLEGLPAPYVPVGASKDEPLGSYKPLAPPLDAVVSCVQLKTCSANSERLDGLLKEDAKLNLKYLAQLRLIEEREPHSSLVKELLDLLPGVYSNLAELGLKSYSKQAYTLTKRIAEENPLSLFTNKLLQFATVAKGRWLTAALNLTPELHKELITHLCSIHQLSNFEENLTFLASAQKNELVEELLKSIKDNNPSSSVLREWVKKGDLSFACWVSSEDKNSTNEMYQQLRQVIPSSFQRTLLCLYRSWPNELVNQSGCIQWLMEQTEELLSKILYFQKTSPEKFEDFIINSSWEGLKKAAFSTSVVLPSVITDLNLDAQYGALKEQFQFAVLTADLLLNRVGTINRQLIEEVRNSTFFQKNKEENSTVYTHLEHVFSILETNGEFSERLSQGAKIPPKGSPAYTLILQTLGKDKDHLLTLRDVQVVILSCLLQKTWQSPNVGSCFGTSVAIQMEGTETLLLQSLDDYLALTATSSLTRVSEQTTTSYPLFLRAETELVEHPFAKAREYCIASMATDHSHFAHQHQVSLFNDCNGIIGVFLNSFIKDLDSHTAIKSLVDKLRQEFMDQCLDLFDITSNEQKQPQYRWILGNRLNYDKIDSQEKYQQFLLQIIEKLETQAISPLEKEALELLKGKIQGEELGSALQYYFSKIGSPWVKITGGNPLTVSRVYFEDKQRDNLLLNSKSYEDDLELFYQLAQLYSKESLSDKKSKCALMNKDHAYNLDWNHLSYLQGFASFDALKSSLEGISEQFSEVRLSDQQINAWILSVSKHLPAGSVEKWIDFLKMPKESVQTFSSDFGEIYIKEKNMRDFGLFLIESLRHIYPQTKQSYFLKIVENCAVNLKEFDKQQPLYIPIGDLNWVRGHNSVNFGYGISPFSKQIEFYTLLGNEHHSSLGDYEANFINEIGYSLSERPWEPLKV